MFIQIEKGKWTECQELLLSVMKLAGKQLRFIHTLDQVQSASFIQEFDELNQKVTEICLPSSSSILEEADNIHMFNSACMIAKFGAEKQKVDQCIQTSDDSCGEENEHNRSIVTEMVSESENINNNQSESQSGIAQTFKPIARVKRLSSIEKFSCSNCLEEFQLRGDLNIHTVVCSEKRKKRRIDMPSMTVHNKSFNGNKTRRSSANRAKLLKSEPVSQVNLFHKENVTCEEIAELLKNSIR